MVVNMKKVLHLRSSFDPGGTETLLLNLFNFPQQYFRIYFVLLKDGTLISQLDEQRSGNLYFKWFRSRFFDLSVLRKLSQLVKREQIELVHTHQFIELVYAVGLKLLCFGKLRIVHQVHLLFEEKDLAFYLERTLSRLFARVVTVSKAAKDTLVADYGFDRQRVGVLYNAVTNGVQPGLDLDAARAQLGVPLDSKRINVCMVANFVWGKDHETIFAAYDQYIRGQLPDVSLYLIGKESQLSRRLVDQYLLEEDVHNGRVVLCGAIPNASALLPLFDMAVMSCFSETFNIALVEAACAGKVILASDIPVFRELSGNGKYFRLFEAGNPKDFFDNLQAMISQLDSLETQTAANHFRRAFSYPAFVKALDEIYTAEASY